MGTKSKATTTRNGQPLTALPKGHRRRMSDGRNAWRKMTPAQRGEFLAWMAEESLPVEDAYHCATCGAIVTDSSEHTHHSEWVDNGGLY